MKSWFWKIKAALVALIIASASVLGNIQPASAASILCLNAPSGSGFTGPGGCTVNVAPDVSVSVGTNRSVYKPGQTIQFNTTVTDNWDNTGWRQTGLPALAGESPSYPRWPTSPGTKPGQTAWTQGDGWYRGGLYAGSFPPSTTAFSGAPINYYTKWPFVVAGQTATGIGTAREKASPNPNISPTDTVQTTAPSVAAGTCQPLNYTAHIQEIQLYYEWTWTGTLWQPKYYTSDWDYGNYGVTVQDCAGSATLPPPGQVVNLTFFDRGFPHYITGSVFSQYNLNTPGFYEDTPNTQVNPLFAPQVGSAKITVDPYNIPLNGIAFTNGGHFQPGANFAAVAVSVVSVKLVPPKMWQPLYASYGAKAWTPLPGVGPQGMPQENSDEKKNLADKNTMQPYAYGDADGGNYLPDPTLDANGKWRTFPVPPGSKATAPPRIRTGSVPLSYFNPAFDAPPNGWGVYDRYWETKYDYDCADLPGATPKGSVSSSPICGADYFQSSPLGAAFYANAPATYTIGMSNLGGTVDAPAYHYPVGSEQQNNYTIWHQTWSWVNDTIGLNRLTVQGVPGNPLDGIPYTYPVAAILPFKAEVKLEVIADSYNATCNPGCSDYLVSSKKQVVTFYSPTVNLYIGGSLLPLKAATSPGSAVY